MTHGLQVLICAFPLLAGIASAQAPYRVADPNLNAWFMYFGDHPVKGPWSVHLEGQLRRYDGPSKPQQLLLRPGVNLDITRHFMLTLGYAFVDTHRYGEFPVAARFPEHRAFQQGVLRHFAGRVGFAHRYRLEQRFLGEMAPDLSGRTRVANWRHENRFRYMVRGMVPLRGAAIDPGSWYFAGYNELFVNFGKNVAANLLDQNRAYAALGFDMGTPGRVEFGYLYQVLQQRNGRVIEHNHTIQAGLYSQFYLRALRPRVPLLRRNSSRVQESPGHGIVHESPK